MSIIVVKDKNLLAEVFFFDVDVGHMDGGLDAKGRYLG
jgi:hypothetical protein